MNHMPDNEELHNTPDLPDIERNRQPSQDPYPLRMPPAPAPQEVGYTTTPGERAVLAQFNLAALNAKCEIYDLQVALELARAKVTAAQASFIGAITLLANTHGMSTASITPDLTRIIPQ